MKGLEISKQFYLSYGLPMLNQEFSELLPKMAIGLIGQGSECFGYDDEISKDHDFDPGFCIFIPDDFSDDIEFRLERAYSYLPNEYLGYKREIISPVGGNRHGIIRLSDFLNDKIGRSDANLELKDFLYIPEESLAELTNGEIWRDDSKMLTSIRLKLSYFPEDIKLKKLAGELLIMAQSGQYNFKRCLYHEELGAARLALYEFVNSCLHAIFIINEVYMPYYKWKFRAFRDLSWPRFAFKDTNYNIEEELNYLLSLTDENIFNENIILKIDNIASKFVDRLKIDGLSDLDDVYLEMHAYEVNKKIKNIDIRNMHILAAV